MMSLIAYLLSAFILRWIHQRFASTDSELSATWFLVSSLCVGFFWSLIFTWREYKRQATQSTPQIKHFLYLHARYAFLAAALVFILFIPQLPKEGIASSFYRHAIIAPFIYGLSGFLGASIGLIFFGLGHLDAQFLFESRIGLRYLRSLRGSPLSLVTLIALCGVILGVALLIVSLGILSGFENDLVDKVIATNAHLVIEDAQDKPIDAARTQTLIRALPEQVKYHSPIVYSEILIASDSNHSEARLFGVEPKDGAQVLSVFNKITEGQFFNLQEAASRPSLYNKGLIPPTFNQTHQKAAAIHFSSVIMGTEMAKQLHVSVGHTVTLVSPFIEEYTPSGLAPKTQTFEIIGIFDSKMYEYDAHYLYVTRQDALDFLEYPPDTYSSLALAIKEPEQADKIAQSLEKQLQGQNFRYIPWMMRNKNLMMSLKLEKAVAFIVLVFIVLVASFSIVNTLTMMAIEKAKEIAIMKSMGMTEISIVKIFIVQGGCIGMIGTIIGALLGCGVAMILTRIDFMIDPDVYFINTIPVRLYAGDITSVCLLSCLLTTLSAIFPALSAAQTSPSLGLRSES